MVRGNLSFRPRAAASAAASLIVGLAAAVALQVAPAAAAGCVVNNNGDAGAANAATGCDTSTAGQVTLRSAIEHFNSIGGTNAITFNLPNPSTITLGSVLAITNGTLTVSGPGARQLFIDGNNSVQVITTGSGTTTTISGMTIQHGNTGSPGAVRNAGGTLTIDAAHLTNNTGTGYGSAVANTLGNITVTNTTIDNNVANVGPAFSIENGTANLTNVTISTNHNTSGNEATGLESTNGQAVLNLTNVTVADNSTTGTPSAINPPAGVGIYDNATASFKNTIIANNAPQNCYLGGSSRGSSSTDNGYNLETANACGFTPGTPKFDQVTTNPNLGPLANNGGPTDTRALLTGSPAIDAVKAGCPPPATDQRGFARASVAAGSGAFCDIGAFEVLAAVTASPSPSPSPSSPGLPRAGGAPAPSGPAAPAAVVALLAVAVLTLGACAVVEALRGRSPG